MLIEENPSEAQAIQDTFAEAGTSRFQTEHVDQLSDALERLRVGGIDVVLLDPSLRGERSSVDILTSIQSLARGLPIIVLADLDDTTFALRAVSHGAQDYVIKGHTSSTLLSRTMRYAIERKRIEAALRKSEDRYRRMLDTAQEGIWILDADGKITYVNERMADMFGYAVTEMKGCDFSSFVEEQIRAEAREIFERHIED